ncbi:sensor histidine kinase [Lutimonas zeaxanthinifaciens]|uniref:sensor histidine kinase n=1 Tax=Lutimonas zeaxanthinifaciens TaxID=3060215 RepID=UPI00265CEC4F|nr:histidine kinase [Lutimonas sp. YSD2104]WKK66967.1 histidine kinase [Lutimonas sp. YSD2104]
MFRKLFSEFRIPLRYHLLFWLIYFVFNFFRFASINNDYWYSLKSNLIEFPLNIVITYFTIYYLIPRYILKKKYLQFLLLFIPSLLLFYLIRTGLNYILVSENIWPEAQGNQEPFTVIHVVELVIGAIYVIALVSAIKLTYDWANEKKRNEDLQRIQLETELNFLKSQIQPHFFFNTLNNLYALVIKQSPNAANVVMKLSEIMQYVLYEVKEPKISLLKSINYLYSYLELEKLRYGDRVKSEISIDGDIDEVEVPPLLFLPFIENCFKHGARNQEDINVLISFVVKDNFLYFTVTNNYVIQNDGKPKHGIGIENVKRRLHLLYGSKYSLKTRAKGNEYSVNLKLPLHED